MSNTSPLGLSKSASAADLYERDFYEWTRSQPRAVESGSLDDIDWDNLAEEIESLGRTQRRAVQSHLEGLMAHLLKCMVQLERRTASWDRTIRAQQAIVDLIEASPSLTRFPAERLTKAYKHAVLLAARDTGLDETRFPQQCPFTVEDILDPNFDLRLGGKNDRVQG